MGITSEPKAATEDFIEGTGARYAYAYDTSEGLMRALGVRGYPTAVLVDPSGTVVWQGHPSEIDAELLAPHLEGAFQKPLWDWPKSASRVRKALEKREYGKALEELAKVEGEELAGIRAGIETIVAKRLATLEKAHAEGDFLAASEQAQAMQAELAGLATPLARVTEIRDALRADKDVKRVIKLQEKLRELRETRLHSPNAIRDLIVEVEALAEKAAGTYPAKQAAEFVLELRAMLQR